METDLIAAQKATPLRDFDRGPKSVDNSYETQLDKGQNGPIDPDEVEFLQKVEIPYVHEDWIRTVVKNKPGVNPKGDNNILVTSQDSKNGGIIIHDSRNKENDLLPKEDKLPWSDMVMNNWKKSCLGTKEDDSVSPDSLKFLIQDDIATGASALNTRRFIEAAIERKNGNPEQVNVFRSDPNAPGMTAGEMAGCQLLAGSDHVHRVNWMLKDYPATMKNIRIESLHVTTYHTVGAENTWFIVIKFMKVAEP